MRNRIAAVGRLSCLWEMAQEACVCRKARKVRLAPSLSPPRPYSMAHPDSRQKVWNMGSLGLTKEAKRMVIVLLAGAVLVVLNQTLLSPALPSIMVHMNVDATTVQWLTSAYALVEAVVIPLAAWFIGRFSTRQLFIGGMILFGAGSLVAAIAPVFAVLLLGRVMQAASTGVLMVMVMSLILLSFPRESRGQAMGLVSLVIAFAPAVGPSLGGLLVDMVGWRALFCVVVVCTAVVLVFAAKVLANREGFPHTSADALSIVLSSLGLVSLLYGISSFASSPAPAVCVVLMVVGVALLGLFAWRQFKLDEPMLRLEVFKSRRYRVAACTCAVLQAILIGLSVLMPLYIQNVLGHSATVSGLITLPGAVLGAFGSLFAGRMFDRSGVRAISLIGVVMLVVGCVGMAFYGMDSVVPYVIVANVATCLAIQLLFTPINTWGVNSLSNDLVQHATSVTNTMNQVGASLGTALIMSFSAVGSASATQGSEVERVFAGYHLSYIAVLVISIVALAMIAVFVRNKKTDVAPSAARVEVKPGRHRVADVMDASPVTIPEGASMAFAARALIEADASGAVVVDGQGVAKGYVSNSDILRTFGDEMQTVTGASGFMALRMPDDENVRDRALRLADTDVASIATKQVVGIAPDATFEEACRMIAEKRLKELPVIDDGKLVGVVRRRSLMKFIATMLTEEEKARLSQ